MAYTPINWQTGDTITAEKLNRCDNGWGVESTELFSETVTTVAGQRGNSAALAYSTLIAAPTITVTFDGTDYTCDVMDFMFKYYGGFTPMGLDPTDYPFYIESTGQANNIYTETAGTHTIAVSVSEISVGDTFRDAVITCSDSFQLEVVSGGTTFSEAYEALIAGKRVYCITEDERQGIALFADPTTYTVCFITILNSSAQYATVFTLTAETESDPLT